jgi:hypothetical protein
MLARLVRTERAGRTPQQRARQREFAELRHRDAAQCQRRRILAQGDVLQGAQRVATGKRARCSGDEGIHGRGARQVRRG